MKKNYKREIEPSSTNVIDMSAPWVMTANGRSINFRRLMHMHCDVKNKIVVRHQIVDELRHAIWSMRHEKSHSTLENLYTSGAVPLLKYLDKSDKSFSSICDLQEQDLIEYVAYLKQRRSSKTGEKTSYASARTCYSALKTILQVYSRSGAFDMSALPTNPFPNVNRSSEGAQPYSKDELRQILRALNSELKDIRRNTSEFSLRTQLGVYFFLLLAKTGLNKTPLEEATRDCLKPHPLMPKTASLLYTYKRRGVNSYVVNSLNEIGAQERVTEVPNSVGKLLKEVFLLTEPLVEIAQKGYENRLWLYVPQGKSYATAPSNTHFQGAMKPIIRKYDLKQDDGKPLTIAGKRLRKTFAKRIWQITNGDIWRTARALGNTPNITNRHYLDVSPEMEKKHKFVGMALEIKARGKTSNNEAVKAFAEDAKLDIETASKVLSGVNNTRVSRCSDPVGGKYAPNNGVPCTRLIHCFRCPNQVVLENDLDRLYSFYWAV